MPDLPEDDVEDSLPLRELQRLWGGTCRTCRRPYCGHEAIFSIALGFKDAPRCLTCLAQGLGQAPLDLRTQLLTYVQRRDCYARAWAHADRQEATLGQTVPGCLVPASAASSPFPSPHAAESSNQESWDAGDMACGDLVLALRIRMNKLPPGSVLTVTARDPAAPEDLPAWCRMTGHCLLRCDHPEYVIRRKES